MANFSGTICPLAAADKRAWAPLWKGYLEFYQATVAEEVSERTFARLLDDAEPMFGLVADEGGRLIGIAHSVLHRSTWTRGPYLYLQDLFVASDVRGSGVGRALIEAVYARADALGAERVHWLTHEGNATARLLYDRIAERSGFIQYRRR